MLSVLSVLAVLLVASCEDGAPPGPGGGPGGVDAGGGGGMCARPAEGCLCAPGADPVPCYGDAEIRTGGVMCHVGSMSCRGGLWSACESTSSYFLEMDTTTALITPPTECNPCNPDCFTGSDYPDDGDLTPGNSSGVEYNTAFGGLVLNGCGIAPQPLLRYPFDGGDSGTLTPDRSPPSPTVNLVADNPGMTTFGSDIYGGYVDISDRYMSGSAAASDDLGTALMTANTVTVEMWVTATDGTQTGPARLVTYSNGTSERAFTVAQEADAVVVRFHNSMTNVNGTTNLLTASGVFPTGAVPVHIVLTWDGTTGEEKLYVEGVLVDSFTYGTPVDLSTWSLNDTFMIGNEVGGARDWDGRIYHLSVYGQVLDDTAVFCRFQAGPDPTDSYDDADGDGVADVADDCPGPGWRSPCDGDATNDGIFHSLPFGGAPELDTIDVSTTITGADIYVLMDASGSMSGEINNLRTDLTTGTFDASCADGVNGGILGAIRCTIAGAHYGLGFFVEYPDGVAGDANSVPYRHLIDITPNLAAIQAAANALRTDGNIDTPEAHLQALYAMASGNGLGAWIPNRRPCSDATSWGYPCFRNGQIPIVLLFSDAAFHNGPPSASNQYNYTSSSPSTVMPPGFPVLENNAFTSAYDLGLIDFANGVTVMGSTQALTNNVTVGCNSGANDAVFRFQIGGSTAMAFTSRLSDFDTVLGLYDNAATPFSLACNDDRATADGPYAKTSQLASTQAAGTYNLVVDGRDGASPRTGSFQVQFGTGGTATHAAPITWAEGLAALTSRSVRIITILSDPEPNAEEHANLLGVATGSVDGVGSPYVYHINPDGTGLSTAVVTAVQDLANFSRFDVELVAEDNTATTTIDERDFLDSTTPTDCPSAACTPGLSGSMCLGCLPGTDVGFTAAFRNDVVMPALLPQVFEFDLVLLANGVIELDRVTVRIVVPPEVPFFPDTGLYTETYDATTFCDIPTTRPDWGNFDWTITTPADSYVVMQIRTAPTSLELGAATPISFTIPTSIPSGAPPLDMGQYLVNNGQSNMLPFLKVTATLHSSSDGTQSPILYGFEQSFTCTPAE